MAKQRQRTYKGDTDKSHRYDQCQTPPYAVDPLLPFLDPDRLVWEPACGEGNIVWKLDNEGFGVSGTDLLKGLNFFKVEPPFTWDCQVTNPPFSTKYQWIERSYELGKPFALLMPVATLGAWGAQKHFREHGIEVMFLHPRVNFKMPNKGYNGRGAHFPVAWFCWKLNLPKPIIFRKLTPRPDEQLTLLK